MVLFLLYLIERWYKIEIIKDHIEKKSAQGIDSHFTFIDLEKTYDSIRISELLKLRQKQQSKEKLKCSRFSSIPLIR